MWMENFQMFKLDLGKAKESEKWSESESPVWLCNPMHYIVHGIPHARILEWVAFPFSRGSSQPWIKPRSPILQMDSLPAEPQGKPKNTGVGNLSLLQWIFLTQESNWGLLHCRKILYHWSYQEPIFPSTDPYFSGFFFAYMWLPEASWLLQSTG